MSTTVAVLGCGKVGAAVSTVLALAGRSVRLWARRPELARQVSAVAVGSTVAGSVAEACRDATVVCFAVPTHALREVARAAGEFLTGDQVALHACRGVELGFTLPHQLIRAESCLQKIGVLGGPLYLEELVPGRPLVAVLASRFDHVQRVLRSVTAGTPVRLHASRDVVGVEVCGAVSNVAQLAAGLAAGLGLGETDQGILLTRGLAEATRIGLALGAERATFAGLAGVGELIPRSVTSTRRHRALGEQVGSGQSAAQAVARQADLEGLLTAREGRQLGERLGLSLPLMAAVDAVFFEGKDPRAMLDQLLSLDLDLEGAA